MAGRSTDEIIIRIDSTNENNNVDLGIVSASNEANERTRSLLEAVKQFNVAVQGDYGLVAEFREQRTETHTVMTMYGKTPYLHSEDRTVEYVIADDRLVEVVGEDFNGKQEYALHFESKPEGLGIGGTVAITPANIDKVKDAFFSAAEQASSLREKLANDGKLSDDDHAQVEVKARQVLRKHLGNIR